MYDNCILLYLLFPPPEAPLRLIVLKNGVRDVNQAAAVVGPDLTNVSANTLKITLAFS